MKSYDLIAFDMDGTLLDSGKRIRQDSLEMIHEASLENKIVVLSTGRSVPELLSYRKELKDVRYCICASGAEITEGIGGKVLYSQSIQREIALKLFERIRDFDAMIHFHSDSSIIQKDYFCRMQDYQMGNYTSLFKDVTLQVDDIIEYYRKTNVPLYKINLYSKSPEERERLKALIQDMELTEVYSEITSLECSARGVSKGSGLVNLCRIKDIPLDKTIAVGDSFNDLEILKAAGLSVAMGNAREEVKSISDVTVKSNDEGGCAEAIREYLLEKRIA